MSADDDLRIAMIATIDDAFERYGEQPTPELITDAIIALLGRWDAGSEPNNRRASEQDDVYFHANEIRERQE